MENNPANAIDPTGLGPCGLSNYYGLPANLPCDKLQGFPNLPLLPGFLGPQWNALQLWLLSIAFTPTSYAFYVQGNYHGEPFSGILNLSVYGNIGLIGAIPGLSGGGNTTGPGAAANNGSQQPQLSPQAQACVNQANKQVQNELQTFSGYAGGKLIGRAALGAFTGALTSFWRFSKTGNPWVVATGAAVGASIGAGWSILSDVSTIQKIQNSFMDKFVACMQSASAPKPPE